MKSIKAAALLAFLVPGMAIANGCDGILKIAPDLTFNTTSVNVAESIFTSQCSGSERRSDASSSAGLDVVIDKVPAALKLGSGSTEEKIEHLCMQYEGWREVFEDTISLATRTNDKLYDAWVACQRLQEDDVFFSVNIYPQVVNFNIRRGTDIINFLGMEYNSEHMSCSGPFGRGGSEIFITRATRYKIETSKTLPITCTRKPFEVADGSLFYPATAVTLEAEGAEALTIPLPREEEYEPAFASEIRAALVLLQSQLDDLKRQTEEADNAVMTALTEQMQARRAEFRSGRDSVDGARLSKRYAQPFGEGVVPIVLASVGAAVDEYTVRVLDEAQCGIPANQGFCVEYCRSDLKESVDNTGRCRKRGSHIPMVHWIAIAPH